jgi:localization factor PodJL
MKSGGPWNIKGLLRPEAREAAREAARQSGLSVGEWLNNVIETNGEVDDEPGPRPDYRHAPAREESRSRHREHQPRRDEKADDPYRNGAERPRHAGAPYRDEQPPYRDERQPYGEEHGDDPRPARNGRSDRDHPRKPRPRREESREHAEREHRPRREQLPEHAEHEHRPRREDDPERHANHRDPHDSSRARREDHRDRAAERMQEFERTGAEIAAVNDKLDRLTHQLERMGRDRDVAPKAPPRDDHIRPSYAADAPYAQLTGAPMPPRRDFVPPRQPDRAFAVEAPLVPERPAPVADVAIDQAVAEIAQRQRALDGAPAPAPTFAEPAPAMPRPTLNFERRAAPRHETSEGAKSDLSGLEDQLRRITSQIEALRPADGLESAITALRSELSEIGRSLTEALPRRAVDSLEIEVKALAERIDHSRQTGVDGPALASLEQGLTEVREALRGLTTAESLVGVEDAVTALSRKVDVIATNHDPAALQQLEEAIGALRGILNHVASNDTLTKVAEDVRGLASRVDDVANMAASGDALSALENRIDTLASAVHASNEAGHAVPRELERMIAGLIEKLEWIQLTHTDHAALGALEDRIATLMKRLDSSDSRLSHLDAIERGLTDLLVHIEQTRGGGGAADGDAPRVAPVVDALKRDVDEIKNGERRVRDSIEAVHDTVEQVVDRLAMLESGIRGDAKTISTAISAPETAPVSRPTLPPPKPVAVNPIPAAPSATNPAPAPTPMPPSAAAPPAAKAAGPRAPIDPTLPPDHPLEPGSASGRPRSHASPADRIAASEAALGSSKPPVIPDGGKSNFIAAARKAAQAAALAAPSPAAAPEVSPSALTSLSKKLAGRLRTLIVAGSVVAIVVGGVHVVSRMFDDGTPSTTPDAKSAKTPEAENTVGAGEAAKSTPAPVPSKPGVAPLPTPRPTPGKQSMLQDFGVAWPGQIAGLPIASDKPAADLPPSFAAPLVTGSIPNSAPPPVASAPQTVPAVTGPSSAQGAGDKLPATIGGPGLRAAAVNGDAGAAYEVAVRFSEGHGVTQNYEAAAHWLEHAAKLGVAPAQFRLGGFYEKGIGVKKNLATARDLYVAAANKGNAKAMHNLAVLYAEGIDGKPDYGSAAQWFRKAADHGVADSQYNLAVLYARGIGVETNMAEAYKWFTLAAKEGDKEAAKKRDEVGAHLDQQSLNAARIAVQTWSPQAQPEEAITVKMPAGGWDHPAAGAKPKPRPNGAKAG